MNRILKRAYGLGALVYVQDVNPLDAFKNECCNE